MTTWLTLEEGAKHIRAKNSRLLREAIHRGDLPSYRYGKAEIRLKQSDLDAWLESQPWEPKVSA